MIWNLTEFEEDSAVKFWKFWGSMRDGGELIVSFHVVGNKRLKLQLYLLKASSILIGFWLTFAMSP